jgi:hypothetical protein
MKAGLAGRSLALFGLSILFLVGLTVFEHALVGVSAGSERLLTFLLLVLPAAVGAVLGMLSLARREGWAWLAILGLVLNALFALFHGLLLLFAG